ncbi:MAG: hypothetical protein ACM3NQ_24360 [Bacteroidales bacterium]
MADPAKLSRDELYELVWKEPLRTLAKRFGLSDVGLKKLCRRNDIPTPGLGYWAKVEHGKSVTRIPLPPAPARTPEVVIKYREPADVRRSTKAALLETWLASERTPEFHVAADLTSRPQHALVVGAERQLLQTTPDVDGWVVPSPGSLNLRVSEAQRPRAIAILDALLLAVEKRGWTVHTEHPPVKRRSSATPEWYPGAGWNARPPEKREAETGVRILGQVLWFSVIELPKDVPPTEAEIRAHRRQFPYGIGDPPWHKRPSGALRLEISHHLGVSLRRRWTDSDKAPLEDQLNSVLAGMVRIAGALRENALYWARSRRKDILRERRKRDAQLRREALQRDVARLRKGMRRWRWQIAAREFLAVVRDEAAVRQVTDDDFTRWMEWAEDYVERRGFDRFFEDCGGTE